ncbi:hypothetical protein [Bacillus sp. NPDC094106]|uniref:hypothetical protein n=1 Tax=Bacillus sp. NPDC094106 TaxID=3363949 RepID=UPI00383018B1
MKQKSINIALSLIQLFLLVLTLFICSSTMRFLPWFVEDAFGWFGLFVTVSLLLVLGVIMTYLKKRKGHSITTARQSVPFITAIFLIGIMFLYMTDATVIASLIFNFVMVIITIVFLLQDLFRPNKN